MKDFGAFTDLDVTNIASLASNDIWGAAAVNDPDIRGLQFPMLQVQYELTMGGNFVSDDFIAWGIAGGDGEDSGEIWAGGVAEAQAQITTDAAVERVRQAIAPGWQSHYGSTNHLTIVSGERILDIPSPNWKLLLYIFSNALAAMGNVVRWRYVTNTDP